MHFYHNLFLVSKPVLWEYRREAATTRFREFEHAYCLFYFPLSLPPSFWNENNSNYGRIQLEKYFNTERSNYV